MAILAITEEYITTDGFDKSITCIDGIKQRDRILQYLEEISDEAEYAIEIKKVTLEKFLTSI